MNTFQSNTFYPKISKRNSVASSLKFLLFFMTIMIPSIGNSKIDQESESIVDQTYINKTDPAIVKLVIQYTHNPLKWPALHYAIDQNQMDVAKLILQLYPNQATALTPTIKVLRSHLGSNADQDYDWISGYEEGISALELAIRGDHVELASQLLKMGANINEFRIEYDGHYSDHWEPYHKPWVHERCKFGSMDRWTARSPLYWAIQQENNEMISLLLEHGAFLTPCFEVQNIENTKSTSALQLAASLKSTEILKQLLVHQAPEKHFDDKYISLFQNFILNPEDLPALHYAIYMEDIITFKLLLEYGFDIYDQGNSSKSLASRAVEAQDSHFLEILLELSEEISNEALIHAATIGNANIVALLTERLTATSQLLQAAIAAGNIDVAKTILMQPHPMDADGENLNLAIRQGYIDLVKLMLELGYFSEKSLVAAIETQNEEMFFLLFDKGVKSNPYAITQAIQFNQLTMVQALINRDTFTNEEISNHIKFSIRLGRKSFVHLFLENFPPSEKELIQYKQWAIEWNMLDIFLLLDGLVS